MINDHIEAMNRALDDDPADLATRLVLADAYEEVGGADKLLKATFYRWTANNRRWPLRIGNGWMWYSGDRGGAGLGRFWATLNYHVRKPRVFTNAPHPTRQEAELWLRLALEQCEYEPDTSQMNHDEIDQLVAWVMTEKDKEVQST